MGSYQPHNADITGNNQKLPAGSADWDEEVARRIAAEEGVDQLDDEQLAILRSMRAHYARHESFPILANICRKAGSKRRDCVARKFHNPMAAWKIAGLPEPPNIFFTTFDGEKYVPNPFY